MNANNMSENYRLRKHFLKTQEVPTQSLIKKKMSEPLAALYFETMSPKLKLMVGLEPQMKGGGSNWYVPPEDILEGRTVLKPLNKEYLSKLNYLGIDAICTKLLEKRRKSMVLEKNKIISENDEKWKVFFEETCAQLFKEYSMKAENRNSEEIQKQFNDFSTIYATSINTIEKVLFDAATSEIVRIQNDTFKKMRDKYNTLVKEQATALYDKFTNKLLMEKLRLRGEFVETLADCRTEMDVKIHDLKLEKHVNIEKSRQFWECQRLACQVYIALKEQEGCKKDIELSDDMHRKHIKYLSDEIVNKDNEIIRQERKEKLNFKFDTKWQKKICCIIKQFQKFVSYCISYLPANADFFINMEKLMFLQLDAVLENPNTESIFRETKSYDGPRPDPHPFYLFCDKRHKLNELPIKKELCPKRCTSSASHMPVIVINKRCMYAACDNFQQFTNRVEHYIKGERENDTDFTDGHAYEQDVPVKYTTSQHLLELKLESSLLQILRQEIPTVRGTSSNVCSYCKVPNCFCTSSAAQATTSKSDTDKRKTGTLETSILTVDNAINTSKVICEDHEIGLPGQTYLEFVEPKLCNCRKTSKRHLKEHMPVYMRTQSVFDTRKSLPSYEICSPGTLKRLVRKARGRADLPPQETNDKTLTINVATQYSDELYDSLCICFSDDEERFMKDLMKTESPELSKFYNPSTTVNNLNLFDDSGSRTLDSDLSSLSAQDKTDLLRAPSGPVPYPELEEILRMIGRAGPDPHRN